ncbi:hypothetical protein BST33_11170 [Mycolicibacter minnesotensis]|uniref:Uncharacterized protein n=1 Tax=Mycolicibacter minnesotensis TaxID=1118379 RepID=A0A7I7R3S4_9MYCO|nr:cytochrome c oxidase assembly protein [Mycolicibacter minnesotensis]ORB00531.1 hypothetical protein BST33_11170 [Mycolicibacter minnesotensis]BBY33251.1 hypothetical protein MMIN_13120 [Mycolicibacter minnesotensis]
MRTVSGTAATFRGIHVLIIGYVTALAGLVGYALITRDRHFAAAGNSFPGNATSIAALTGYFTATLSGMVVLGLLIYIVVTARPDSRGLIDVDTFRVHVITERVAALWALTAVAMIPLQAANTNGIPVLRLLDSGAFFDALGATETARGWVIVAAFAGLIALALRRTVRWLGHTMVLIPALIAVVALPVTGNAGQGPNHDYSTSAMIVFVPAVAVVIGMKMGAALTPLAPLARRRALLISWITGGIAILYGLVLLAFLLGPTTPTQSDFGMLALLAAGALATVWVGDVIALRTRKTPTDRAAVIGALIMLVVVAAISAMEIQVAPALLARRLSAWDVFLGYELPGSPTVLRLLAFWRFDLFIGAGAIVLAGLYIAGATHLRRRGDAWPMGRTTAWLLGCMILVFVTSSGVGAYGAAMFSVHMSQHMVLNMLVPVLLVLGAPATLMLRTLPKAEPGQLPRPRDWLLLLLHSWPTRWLSHPAIAFTLFVGSLYVVYFTPLLDTLLRYHWGHQFMAVHFILTGYLFFWGIIGTDPGPRRLPFLGRLGLLFAVMPFHAFFGIALMTSAIALGARFYSKLQIPWLPDLIADQHLGGAIAWGSSELPVIIVIVALITLWARQDRRDAARSDRHAGADYATDELDAYNAMLRELARTRR